MEGCLETRIHLLTHTNDSNSEGFSFTRDYHVDNLALASNGNKFNLDLASFRVKSLIYFDLVPRGPNGQLMPNTSYNQLRWLARTTTGRRE